MDSFEQKIADCVNQKLTDGTVEKLIEEKLEKGVADAISELFTYRGKAKEMLVGKFEEVMIPVIEKHDFNQYLTKLDTVLTEIVNNTSIADNAVILDNFKQLMKNPVDDFSIIPISRIYGEWQDYVSENIDTSKLEIDYDDEPSYYNANTSMEVERAERTWLSHSVDEYVVKFTCEEDEDLNCEFKLSGGYSDSRLRIDATTIPMDIHSLRTISKFEIFIQQLMRAWVKVDLDTMSSCDDVEIKAEPEADFH